MVPHAAPFFASLALSGLVVAASCSDKPEEPDWSTNVEALSDPTKATLKAPETFKVQFITTKGDFIVEVTRLKAEFPNLDYIERAIFVE